MLAWATTQSVGLRCGINTGELDLIIDPYHEHNVCGAATNMAARIMDAAHPGQLFVSRDSVVQRLAHDEQDKTLGFRYTVHPNVYEILVKHDDIRTVQTIMGELQREAVWIAFGLPGEPQNKWHLQMNRLAVDDYGIEQLKKPPVALLQRHQKIAFVGATNDTLTATLQEVLRQNPRHRWECMEVFFLTDDRFAWMATPQRSAALQCEAKQQAIRDLSSILPHHVRSWALYEYDRPFFFASYWDWEHPGGRIHVSTQIWGAYIKDCPGFDFVWRTREPTAHYKAYRDGITHLRTLAQPIRP